MKAKTYYIHANTLSGIKRRVNPARRGEAHLVIKSSDIDKLVKRAARVPYAYWGAGAGRPIPVGEDSVRAVFKSIGLLP